MQSANLFGPLKGLCPHKALIGLTQASGLAGGLDFKPFYRWSVPLMRLLGLPLLMLISPFFALKEGLNLRKKVPCEDFQFLFWNITFVCCHKATLLLFQLLFSHSSFTLPNHCHGEKKRINLCTRGVKPLSKEKKVILLLKHPLLFALITII